MENVRAFLLDNVDVLKGAVRELNIWNGSMEHLDVYENDEEFFNMAFEGNPMEAVRATQYGSYAFGDEYVRFDGYGNLESMSEYEYERECKDYVDEIIDNLVECRSHLHLNGELEDLLDEAEEGEEEEAS